MIELRNHPAVARHPRTNEPLADEHDVPIPLIRDQHGIYLDGYMVGYCATSGAWVATICKLDQSVIDEIVAHVTAKCGPVKRVNESPALVERTPPPAQSEQVLRVVHEFAGVEAASEDEESEDDQAGEDDDTQIGDDE